MMAIEQFDELETRHVFLTTQRKDLVDSIAQTTQAIKRIDETTRTRFADAFAAINRNFQESFSTLFGGGRAGLTLLDETDPLESGIEIIAQPPGKRLQSVQLLSGGEKALTAIALMFALFKYKPSPFCLLDEIDAPLDDANIGRFVEMLRAMQSQTQFILITHNRKTMEIADRLYGVTMEEPGCVQADFSAVELKELQNCRIAELQKGSNGLLKTFCNPSCNSAILQSCNSPAGRRLHPARPLRDDGDCEGRLGARLQARRRRRTEHQQSERVRGHPGRGQRDGRSSRRANRPRGDRSGGQGDPAASPDGRKTRRREKVLVSGERLGGIVIGVVVDMHFHVRAPKSAIVRARTSGGDMTVKGFSGHVILNGSNGGVHAEGLAGGIETRWVNGGVNITLASIGNELVDVRVTNGPLSLVVPQTINANLSATATNGRIDVKAPKFEPLGDQTSRRVRGRLNAGGVPIELTTVNGNITVASQ